MRTLYLFSGLTPNKKGQVYYNIKVFANYLTYLRNNFNVVKLLDETTYRINNGTIMLALDNTLRNSVITYAIEYDANSGFHRCYYIDRIIEQSDMQILNITLDNWGTYYLASNVEHLHVSRCNRNIGTGIYDEITSVYTDEVELERLGQFENRYQIGVVMQVNYNVKQPSWVSKERIASAGLYWIPLARFNFSGEYTGFYERVKCFVNGIYGVTSTRLIFESTNDAFVSKAWILPREYFSETGEIGAIELKSKFYDREGTEEDVSIPAMQLTPSIIHQQYTINVDLNYDYIVGIDEMRGIKLVKFTKDSYGRTRNYVRIITKSSLVDLHVYVVEGETEIEITDGFELEITGKSEVETGIRQLSHAVKLIDGEINAIAKGYSKGGGYGAIWKGLTNVYTQIPDYNATNSIQGSGGALVSFDMAREIIDDGYLTYPICVRKYISVCDEKKHARYYGASFSVDIEDINDIFEYDLLGLGDYDLTYVVATDVKVLNTPSTALDEIVNAFTTGVEIIQYEQ